MDLLIEIGKYSSRMGRFVIRSRPGSASLRRFMLVLFPGFFPLREWGGGVGGPCFWSGFVCECRDLGCGGCFVLGWVSGLGAGLCCFVKKNCGAVRLLSRNCLRHVRPAQSAGGPFVRIVRLRFSMRSKLAITCNWSRGFPQKNSKRGRFLKADPSKH